MHRFFYGSRVIENERIVSLETKMEKAGSIIHHVVGFLAMIFVVALLNMLLSNLVQYSCLLTVNLMRMAEQGIALMLSDETLAFVLFLYNHKLGAVFAAVCCAVVFVAVMLCSYGSICFVDVRRSTACSRNVQHKEKLYAAVAYKYKVCFLS